MEKKIESTGFDMDKLFNLMVKFSDKQKNILESMANNKVKNDLPDPELLLDFYKIFSKIIFNPKIFLELNTKILKNHNKAFLNFAEKIFGLNEKKEKKSVKDKRFAGKEWQEPFFEYIKDFYVINSKLFRETVSSVTGMEEKKKKRIEFYTNQMIEAISPSNFLFTNPELLKLTLESNGENLLQGMENFLNDVSCEDGNLDITMSDDNDFQLGKDIAATRGSVVYQNDIVQLIQYEPTTEKVFEVPILLFPPFINKYYILDINEKDSMVKWLLDQGYTVFVISWVNPDSAHGGKKYEDYVLEGCVESLDVVEKITGSPKVSAIGYCTGGTLLATAAAYLEAKKKKKLASLTFMATLIDFSEPGELGYFLDRFNIEKIMEDIKGSGYMDGRQLAKTFNMLKPNDLVWSYAINNYLKGKDPVPFDILYWNSDSTNLPAGMYGFFLQNMYLENRLKDPGGIKINGVSIDISKVNVPAYFFATEEDHIVLWKAAFKGAGLFQKNFRFVLGGSGHVGGVVNPPFKNKYGYRWSDKKAGSPEKWFEQSFHEKGSWWLNWHEWNKGFAGTLVEKRIPGKGKFKEIEKAPGSYALKRSEDKTKCGCSS